MKLKDVTYEQSRAIFHKNEMLDGGSVNYPGSMQTKKQIISGAIGIFFFGLLSFAFSYGFIDFAQFIDADDEGLKLLKPSEIQLISDLAKLVLPVIVVFFVVMTIAFIISPFLPLTLPKRLIYGEFCTYVLTMPMTLISLIPISVGVAVAGAGWVGLALQVFFSGWWLLATWRDSLNGLFKSFGDTEERKDGTTGLDKMLKWLKWPILMGFIVNVIVYTLTHDGSITQRLLHLIICWLPFLFSLALIVAIRLVFDSTVSSWFFLKYADQYRVDYEFTDAEWYGDRRARKMAKKRAQVAPQQQDQGK